VVAAEALIQTIAHKILVVLAVLAVVLELNTPRVLNQSVKELLTKEMRVVMVFLMGQHIDMEVVVVAQGLLVLTQ